MRNYIIFYAAIILFVIGGIKWTSYVIEQEKQKELEKIDFHKNVSTLLGSGGEVSAAEMAGKNIVIYMVYLGQDTLADDYIKLNELTVRHAADTRVFIFSRLPMKDYTETFFKKIKVEPVFKVLYKPREFVNYIQSLSHYFYTKEEYDKVAGRRIVPFTIVVDKTGKIKLYKVGADKDITVKIEDALKE